MAIQQQFLNTKYIIKLHLHFTLLKHKGVSIALPFLGDEIREGGKLVQRSFYCGLWLGGFIRLAFVMTHLVHSVHLFFFCIT